LHSFSPDQPTAPAEAATQELCQTEGERTLAAWMAEQMRGSASRSSSPGRGRPGQCDRPSARQRRRQEPDVQRAHRHQPVTEGGRSIRGRKVDDKFIYGIGVSNMKSGDAAYFCAVKTLIDAGVKLKATCC